MNESNLEWIYGIHNVQTLVKTAPERVQRLLVQKKSSSRLEKLIIQAKKNNIAVERVDPQVLNDISSENHQGTCALCQPGDVHSEKWLYQFIERHQAGQEQSEAQQHTPLLLILDGITDPHNLGACLRTADAVGVDAVIIPRDNSVGMTPVVSKVASGAAESIPLIAVTNLARCMQKLQEKGIWITGTCDKAPQTLHDASYEGATALVLGAEGKGMRRLTRERCDQLISIPMQGVVSSLNVSVAAGVCLFEIQRQKVLIKPSI